MKKLNKYEKRLIIAKRFKLISIFFTLIIIFTLIYFDFDRRMDVATEILINTKSKSIITNTINSSMLSIFKKYNIKSTDLYTTNFNKKGELLTVDVNTVLINDICNTLSSEITNNLSNKTNDVISVPIFSLYDLTLIEGLGPVITNSILPTGSVEVTYDTSFKEAGINQTNFDLWLNVTCTLEMASPITKSETVQTRKIPIISTIINGNVPSYYTNSMLDTN